MRLLAAALFLQTSGTPIPITVRGPADVLDRFSELIEAVKHWHPQLGVAWAAYEEGISFAPLFEGSADILLSSRPIDPRERVLAKKLSLEIHEHVLALDALAVVVHPDNPVESLSLDQVESLFRGKIVGWYGFGGSDRPVRLLAPLPSSGEYQALSELASGADFRLPASAEIFGTSAAVVSTVAADPGAVGLVSASVDRESVRTVPLKGAESDAPVAPSADSVERGEYPWGRVLRLYTRGSADEGLERLLNCLLSSEGQAEIAKAGFVPLFADRAFQRSLPARERSRGATVTAVSFRRGSDRLDREARESLTALSRSVSEVWITARRGLLEDPSTAGDLPHRRARVLEEFLAGLGVTVSGTESTAPASGDLGGADVWWVARR